jgi:cholesterol oxidase
VTRRKTEEGDDMSGKRISLSFSEQMTGFVSLDGAVDYQTGFRHGRNDDTPCGVSLVLEVTDVDAFLRDPDAKAVATGYVDCPKLGGRCVVEKGTVNILVDAIRRRHNIKDFRYRLLFRTPAGRLLTLSGVKFVDDDGIIYIWRNTSKLFTKIFEGDVARAEEDRATTLAAGILRLHLLAFLKMMVLARSEPATPAAWITGMWRFLGFFLGSLWQVHGWSRVR